MKNKKLVGHSGCNITLYSDTDKLFVRKTSANIEYNNRLIDQQRKQDLFQSEYLRSPKILNYGKDSNGLYYFDMEYVNGTTLNHFIKDMNVTDIKYIVDDIYNQITSVNEEYCEQTDEIFQSKIISLKDYYPNNEYFQNAISLLSKFNWGKLKSSKNHGDLTLENIMISRRGIYLIDFLDSFFNSWLFDVAKLMQDTLIHWSFRMEPKIETNTLLRLKIFNDVLLEKFLNNTEYSQIDLYNVILLNLVRIYPYIKDTITEKFLNNKLKYMLDEIKKLEVMEK